MCTAQVIGTFLVDKFVFAPGEPVFLNLTLLNQGNEPEEVITSDPYSFCSGYQIQILVRDLRILRVVKAMAVAACREPSRWRPTDHTPSAFSSITPTTPKGT